MTVLKSGMNCMGIYEAIETGVLIDACDYYRAFYHSARQARRYILLSGWQFDSEVRLLRGEESAAPAGEVSFLRFLEYLCEETPELEIYILAWDYSAVFSLEREWFQEVIFNWTTNKRIRFRFDSNHASAATHHQKFVIIDGRLAFVGGMDICSSRWDDRYHLAENPERVDVDGTPYGCYHDIQTYHTGPVVGVLLALFMRRWADSGAEPLRLAPPEPHLPFQDPHAFPMPVSQVAVSRTYAPVPQTGSKEIHEIRHLFVDAILSADRLIYLENQYFSSQAVYWALIARMSMADRPKLQIILILPDRLPFTEELFLGLPQMKMLESLQLVAQKTGHAMSVYSSALVDQGKRKMTFIHSKLLLIDDRFLTIGSANTTNRSMALDTELNVSWEAADPSAQPELVAAMRKLRASLLAEHSGLLGSGQEGIFEQVEDLSSRLDCLVEDGDARLCRYEPDPEQVKTKWQDALEPVSRVVDPEKPVDDEYIFESLSMYQMKSFAKGIRKLGEWIIGL